MPTWPATLPQYPTLDTISLGSPQSAIVATPMSVGPGKRRPRSSAQIQPMRATYSGLDITMLNAFETWFRVTLAQGSLAFDLIHPFTDATRSWRFSESAPYTLTPWGHKYDLAVSLELMP